MEYRALGALQVSVVGLGCNNFGMRIDADQTEAVVGAAIDVGINYFDTAESYGEGRSEEPPSSRATKPEQVHANVAAAAWPLAAHERAEVHALLSA